MRVISKWLQSNRLSRYNWDRQSLLFGSVHKLRKVSKMKISCNNIQIEPKSFVRYL